ncbi:carboxypeptidase M32 [Alphaproteobacteria bacterium]|nr:carboxypeptidase M32 [Alphaproteobacteria bacterium]
MTKKSYKKLESIFRRILILNSIDENLNWDRSVIMPSGGHDARSDQIAEIQISINKLYNQKCMEDLFEDAFHVNNLDFYENANLREMYHLWRHNSVLSSNFVENYTRACLSCELTWRQAKIENNYNLLKKNFNEVIYFVRELANIKSSFLNLNPYDCLIDQYEQGFTQSIIDPIFKDIEKELPVLIKKILNNNAKFKLLPFPVIEVDSQKSLVKFIMKKLSLDNKSFTLGASAHPFSSGLAGDVRITTRYNIDNFLEALMGVIHETGHAIYENNLPTNSRWQPIGRARGMVFHESQSLFYEMQIGRSREFIDFIYEFVVKFFSNLGIELSKKNLIAHIRNVSNSLIRVNADEVTYPAHILVRYNIEKKIINNELAFEDIPEAWSKGMEKYLGISVINDSEGCLQDIHWFCGEFGYFPTYTLGAVLAAQLFRSMEVDIPLLKNFIKAGNFKPINSWLSEKIHNKGSLLKADELIKSITGKKLSATDYLYHLNNRYLNEVLF